MTNNNWYRRSSWTKEDQLDFFAHLRRARRDNRTQYLRIQAGYLLDTHARENIVSALQLLDMLLREYSSPTQLEQTYYEQARCFQALGQISEAIDSYRLAFAARRVTPNVRTYAPLSFGMLVVSNSLEQLYNETQEVFNSLVESNDIIFPDAKYMYFAVSAIILERSGRLDAAAECAAKALNAASMQRSGFVRHPNIGLVKNRNTAIDAKLRKMVHPGWLDRLNNTMINRGNR